jgi:arsenite methyltransferase
MNNGMKVVFVCIENSNRSQMAEAFARMLGGIEAYSAGSRPSGRVNPKAIEAMRELGYDLAAHQSKSLGDLPDIVFDAAVTMGCGDQCPNLRAARHADWNIPDPKEMPPDQFRAVRDLIGSKVKELRTELELGMSIEQVVQLKYGAVAVSGLSSDHAGVKAVAEAFGYSTDELASIPAEANMGLSCGNPTAFASLRPGETVVDLGCGGGLDVFLAAAKVGPSGKAIGIDMTSEMLALARANAERAGSTNVEFHQATIDKLPLADASVDCVISNCVINLATDKPAVFREIARVLKPGGRLAVSDLALKKSLPPDVANDLMAYVGCIAGAIPIDDYKAGLTAAGFAHVQIIESGADLNAYANVENQAGCCSPAMECGSEVHGDLAELLSRHDVNNFAASVKIFAVKLPDKDSNLGQAD